LQASKDSLMEFLGYQAEQAAGDFNAKDLDHDASSHSTAPAKSPGNIVLNALEPVIAHKHSDSDTPSTSHDGSATVKQPLAHATNDAGLHGGNASTLPRWSQVVLNPSSVGPVDDEDAQLDTLLKEADVEMAKTAGNDSDAVAGAGAGAGAERAGSSQDDFNELVFGQGDAKETRASKVDIKLTLPGQKAGGWGKSAFCG
jgi:hypothetical protein